MFPIRTSFTCLTEHEGCVQEPKRWHNHTKTPASNHTYRAYLLFKQEHPEYPFQYTVFRRSKPRDVVQTGEQHRSVCVCSKHANIQFKLTALQNALTANKIQKPAMLTSVEDLSNATLCPQGSVACVFRRCQKCGVDNIDELNELLMTEVDITYEKWDYIDGVKEGTRRCKLITKRASRKNFLKELKVELKPFSQHVFPASHQTTTMNTLIQNLPIGHAAAVLDFAENYACLYDDEVQSAHWTVQQVTIHPMMFYLHHGESTMEKKRLLKVGIIGISDDLTHDGVAVSSFLQLALKQISEMDDVHPVTKLHQFTDGCAAQYKGRQAFTDMTFSSDDLGVDTVRNIFESGHGKGPCDGLGATVKHSARQAVLQHRAKIRDAKELFAYCQSDLVEIAAGSSDGKRKAEAVDSRRLFLLILKEQMDQLRLQRNREDATVTGTRSIHFAAPVEPYLLHHRKLSCYCNACLQGDYMNCQNGETSGPIETVKLTNGKWKAHTVNGILLKYKIQKNNHLFLCHNANLNF